MSRRPRRSSILRDLFPDEPTTASRILAIAFWAMIILALLRGLHII